MGNGERTWVTKLKCPFCETVIVEACDHSMQPSDISDERWEEITCSEDGYDICEGSCEHLAFWSDWAFAGHRIEKKWNKQIELIAKAIYLADDPEAEDAGEIDIEDTIGSSLMDVESGIVDEEDLLETMKCAVPNIEIEILTQFVEKFAGVKSGGPTYMMIFMKDKT